MLRMCGIRWYRRASPDWRNLPFVDGEEINRAGLLGAVDRHEAMHARGPCAMASIIITPGIYRTVGK